MNAAAIAPRAKDEKETEKMSGFRRRDQTVGSFSSSVSLPCEGSTVTDREKPSSAFLGRVFRSPSKYYRLGLLNQRVTSLRTTTPNIMAKIANIDVTRQGRRKGCRLNQALIFSEGSSVDSTCFQGHHDCLVGFASVPPISGLRNEWLVPGVWGSYQSHTR